MTETEFEVTSTAGQDLGVFKMSNEARCIELKQIIQEKYGTPLAAQEIMIGHQVVKDDDNLLADPCEAGPIATTLLLKFPEPHRKFEAAWRVVPETSSFLEELQLPDDTAFDRFGSMEKVCCAGLDPEVGLLVAVYRPDEGAEFAMVKGDGKGSGEVHIGSGVCVITDNDLFEVEIDASHPLRHAISLNAVACHSGFPLPSIGMAVAIANPSGDAGHLICCELCPTSIPWLSLTDSTVSCEAACVDRTNLVAISIQRRKGTGRHVVFSKLRGDGPSRDDSRDLDQFHLDVSKRATSIAWIGDSGTRSGTVLLTLAGDHAIFAFKSCGPTWTHVATIGDPAARGCCDGPCSELRFWFPARAEPHPSSGELSGDPHPLIPGPNGEVYIHSGGVLMSLALDLSSAIKVTSMREELWLVDGDEGTPTFPTCCSVLGVHQGRVYRCLDRRSYPERVMIRRLQISSELRQGRSNIRADAPRLWPKLTEKWRLDSSEAPAEYLSFGFSERGLPQLSRYHEEDRDKWDGNSLCLEEGDTYLCDGPGAEALEDVRVDLFGNLTCFSRWMDAHTTSHYPPMVVKMHKQADDELASKRNTLPPCVDTEHHPHTLRQFQPQDNLYQPPSYSCSICSTSKTGWFNFQSWGYECDQCGFRAHPYCVLHDEEKLRQEQEVLWMSRCRKEYEAKCKLLRDTPPRTKEASCGGRLGDPYTDEHGNTVASEWLESRVWQEQGRHENDDDERDQRQQERQGTYEWQRHGRYENDDDERDRRQRERQGAYEWQRHGRYENDDDERDRRQRERQGAYEWQRHGRYENDDDERDRRQRERQGAYEWQRHGRYENDDDERDRRQQQGQWRQHDWYQGERASRQRRPR